MYKAQFGPAEVACLRSGVFTELTKEVKDKIDAERVPQFGEVVPKEKFSDPDLYLLKKDGERLPLNLLPEEVNQLVVQLFDAVGP